MEIQKQKEFVFEDKVLISSKFECGNLAEAVQKSHNHYNLWIGADSFSNYKTWFYFSIQNIQKNTLVTFTIVNMNNQLKLFRQGHLPVYRQESEQKWERIKIPLQQNSMVKTQNGFQLSFKYLFVKKQKCYFAFTFPFSNQQNDRFINQLIKNSEGRLLADYKLLTLSTQKRQLKILTITKLQKNIQFKQLQILNHEGSYRPIVFKYKKGIFISARVHPGEVASSFVMNGILKMLFDTTQQAHLLLDKFVFYIVPIINPDGVAEGNFRTDSKGKNLNRFYTNPNQIQEPQIYAIKKLLISMIGEGFIEFCLDLHAHVNKQGSFIYGNSNNDLKGQVEVCLFPKILAFNCPYFDYDACNFSQKNMSSKDKSDDLSKEGASRVAIYKQTGLKACWTLQCNYNSCKIINLLKQTEQQSSKSVSNGVLLQKNVPLTKQAKHQLNIKQFETIGNAICSSILDYYHLRKSASYYANNLKNRDNFILNLGIQCLKMIPFRFDNNQRKIIAALNGNMNISSNIDLIRKKLQSFQIGKYKKSILKRSPSKINQQK